MHPHLAWCTSLPRLWILPTNSAVHLSMLLHLHCRAKLLLGLASRCALRWRVPTHPAAAVAPLPLPIPLRQLPLLRRPPRKVLQKFRHALLRVQHSSCAGLLPCRLPCACSELLAVYSMMVSRIVDAQVAGRCRGQHSPGLQSWTKRAPPLQCCCGMCTAHCCEPTRSVSYRVLDNEAKRFANLE